MRELVQIRCTVLAEPGCIIQALAKSRDSLLAARSDATAKAAEAQYSNDRATAALQQATRLQSDLDAARSALSKTQEKLLETHQALTDSHSEKANLRARTATAEGDVEGARVIRNSHVGCCSQMWQFQFCLLYTSPSPRD